MGVSALGSLELLYATWNFAEPFRWATVTMAPIYLLGLLTLPFAPETKDQPLPD